MSGHEPRTREVTGVRGVTERWSVTLPTIAPAKVDAAPVRKREPLWPTGWALTGVGVSALAVGIAFLAIDDQPYRSRCSGDDYDPAQDLCRYRWRSLVHGAVLTGIGGAVAVAGVTLVGVGHRRRVRAVAAFGPTGGGLAIAGRF